METRENELVFEVLQEHDGDPCEKSWLHHWQKRRSHIVLETDDPTHRRIAIPDHKSLRLRRAVPGSILGQEAAAWQKESGISW